MFDDWCSVVPSLKRELSTLHSSVNSTTAICFYGHGNGYHGWLIFSVFKNYVLSLYGLSYFNKYLIS